MAKAGSPGMRGKGRLTLVHQGTSACEIPREPAGREGDRRFPGGGTSQDAGMLPVPG